MRIGMYGRAFLASLEANQPARYARQKAAGQLNAEAGEAEARAQTVFQSALAELLRKDPPPRAYLERVQHRQVLESQASELAMEEIVVRPDPDAEEPPPPPGAISDTPAVLTTS